MPLKSFDRLANRVLARLGENAVLRSDTECRVNIEYNSEVAGTEGQMVFSRPVGTMLKSLQPRLGDTLVLVDDQGSPIPGETFKIDSPPFEENGVTARYVLLKTP